MSHIRQSKQLTHRRLLLGRFCSAADERWRTRCSQPVGARHTTTPDAKVEGTITTSPLGTGVVLARRPDQVGVEVGDAGEHLRPVRADLLGAEEGSIRMQGLLAAVLRVKASDEGVHSRRSPAPQELRPIYSS
jgi:hypothetical protein